MNFRIVDSCVSESRDQIDSHSISLSSFYTYHLLLCWIIFSSAVNQAYLNSDFNDLYHKSRFEQILSSANLIIYNSTRVFAVINIPFIEKNDDCAIYPRSILEKSIHTDRPFYLLAGGRLASSQLRYSRPCKKILFESIYISHLTQNAVI